MGNSKKDSDKDWMSEIEELRLRETLASQIGGPENLERQRASGRPLSFSYFCFCKHFIELDNSAVVILGLPITLECLHDLQDNA